MAALQNLVESCILTRNLIRPGQRLLVAVSGGLDSIVLLHLLAGLAKTHRWKLVVAHYNHQLRGVRSDKDEQFVRQTAGRLRLPIVVARGNVLPLSQQEKISIEMAARQLRHQFLARTARIKHIHSVALAHHLDDQVELFFLRLFRGSGAQGLSGMRWTSPSPADPGIHLLRPLLAVAKHDLLAFARASKLKFRHDDSNDQLDFKRNRIRQELLPLLEKNYQAGVRGNVLRAMELLEAETDFLEKVAESWLKAHLAASQKGSKNRVPAGPRKTTVSSSGASSFLIRAHFDDLPRAIQRRCIQIQLLNLRFQPEFDLIEHLRLNPGQPIDTPAPSPRPFSASKPACGYRLKRSVSGLVEACPLPKIEFNQGSVLLDLTRPTKTKIWDGVRFNWKIVKTPGSARFPRSNHTEFFDADKVGNTVLVRHWRPGDRFQPIGMPNSVKLQDLFTNEKIPRAVRTQLAVGVTGAGELFWVEGLRISERFKLSNQTNRRLHWAWQRL